MFQNTVALLIFVDVTGFNHVKVHISVVGFYMYKWPFLSKFDGKKPI